MFNLMAPFLTDGRFFLFPIVGLHMRKTKAKGLRSWWAGALVVGMMMPVWAQTQPAGVVQSLRGDVRIERGGQAMRAEVDMPVFAQDRIVTAPLSSVGITLRDNTRISLGGKTNIVLEQYQFAAGSNEGSLVMRVLRGSMGTVTGLIARNPSNQVEVRTKTATAGVRGTEFLVEVPDDEQ
jgi:hypothetical protein